jgi:hypothetical protein
MPAKAIVIRFVLSSGLGGGGCSKRGQPNRQSLGSAGSDAVNNSGAEPPVFCRQYQRIRDRRRPLLRQPTPEIRVAMRANVSS